MKCRDIRAYLSHNRQADDALRRHLEECHACRQLADDHGRLADALDATDRPSRTEFDPARLWSDAINAEHDFATGRRNGIASTLATSSLTVRAGLVIATIVAIGALVFLAMRRADFAVYPPLRMAAILVGFGAVATAAAVASLRPVHRPEMSRPARWSLLTLAVVTPLVAAVWPISSIPAANALATKPLTHMSAGHALTTHAFICFGVGVAVSALVLLVFWMVRRDQRLLAWPTLFAAGTAGLAGNIALQLFCPNTHQAHLVASHATVSVVLTAAALILVFSTRSKSQSKKIQSEM
jgi:hypothetical protein